MRCVYYPLLLLLRQRSAFFFRCGFGYLNIPEVVGYSGNIVGAGIAENSRRNLFNAFKGSLCGGFVCIWVFSCQIVYKLLELGKGNILKFNI